MTFSDEMIKQVGDLSASLTPISEMAVLLDTDVEALRIAIRDKSTTVSKAYYRAKAETKLKLRKQEIELAGVGSPLAVQLSKEYVLEMDSDEDI